jgi:hypothetical protein
MQIYPNQVLGNHPTLFDDIHCLTGMPAKFVEYHKENPQIYQAFKRIANEAIGKGHKNLSAEFIFNVIRWQTGVEANGDEFKVNNNYKAFYSRLFMEEYPEYNDFFRTRKSNADEVSVKEITST